MYENFQPPERSFILSDSAKFLCVTPLFRAGRSSVLAGRRFSPVICGLAI